VGAEAPEFVIVDTPGRLVELGKCASRIAGLEVAAYERKQVVRGIDGHVAVIGSTFGTLERG
jgi:hypothetical protein